MLLQPGDEPIPGYRLEKFLGRGQFGQVWRATSPGKTSVALKFLDLSGKPGRKEFRAIQRVKQIRHAHLMPIVALWLLDKEGRVLDDDVLDEFSEESSLVAATLNIADVEEPQEEPATLVVAQLLADKTLGDRLQECQAEGSQGIPAKELLVYMEETARGIDFLNTPKHDLGTGRSAIQHCDIKPANLLLSGDSVLVTDYGVAQVLAGGSSARATSMVGSPAYMAPECISQKPSSASDQYSLAVSYVELRTGKLPFAAETFTEVLDAHRQGKLDLSGLLPAEAAVVRKATAVAPEQRYASAQEMVEALRLAVFDPQKSLAERSRWSRLLPVVLVSLAACGLVWILATRSPTPVESEREPPPDPQHFAQQALQQLESGNLELAAEDFAAAIQHDPLGQFQTVPSASHQYRYDADGPIHRAVVSPDRRWLLTWGGRDLLRLWDLAALPADASRSDLHPSQPGRDCCSLTLNNHWAAVAYAGSGDLFLLPLQPPGRRARLPLEPGLIEAQITPDERWLLTSTAGSGTGLEYQLQRWDLHQEDLQATATEVGRLPQLLLSLTVSADSQYVLAGDIEGGVTRFALPSAPAPPEALAQGTGDVTCLLSFPAFVAAAGEIMVQGDFAQGADVGDPYRIAVVKDDAVSMLPIGHALPIRLLAADASYRWLASASDDNQLHVWDAQALAENDPARGRPAVLASVHASVVQQMAYDPSGQWLICAGGDGQGGAERVVLLWDFQTAGAAAPLELRGNMGAVKAVTVTSDQRWLVVCGEHGVWVWDFRRCILLKRACDRLGIPARRATSPSSTSVDT